MSLTVQDIEIITRLLKDSAFDELDLEIDGLKLTLRRATHPPTVPARAGVAVLTDAVPGTPGGTGAAAVTGAAPGAPAAAVPGSPAAGPQAATPTASPAVQPVAGRTGSAGVSPPAANANPGQPRPPADAAGGTLVTAPLLGTFYRAPRPGVEPFVKEGSEVEPDTVIGIIEVMKLMNAVHAGLRGRVSEILAQDGALVEYGQPLLRVSPPGA